MNTRHTNTDTPLADKEENTRIDVSENPNADKTDTGLVHIESLNTEIDRSLHTLTESQKQEICCCFGTGVFKPWRPEDIGQKFCLTGKKVRQSKK